MSTTQRQAAVPAVSPGRWDIFCSVIDNFGDIGVAWRLARQLAGEHGLSIRLWIDALDVFQRLWPEVDPVLEAQRVDGVEVRRWTRSEVSPSPPEAADVVIDAFGCGLPEAYIEAMAARVPAPVWVNLEYLSAEAWVGSHHGLPSLHPRLPVTRHFFFPGYGDDTGGLLREAGLIERAATFRAREAAGWRSALGVPDDALCVSLFAYDNPALPALLDAWAEGVEPVACLVPEGKIVPRVAAWLGEDDLQAGDVRTRGMLTLRVLPFVRQDDYDTLLWACDVNFVRGEDSCVRAQWAGAPMVWQAYPQEEGAHRDKLDALFSRCTADWPETRREALQRLWLAWNGFAPPADAVAGWRGLPLAAWKEDAGRWRDALAAQDDLATRLEAFVRARQLP